MQMTSSKQQTRRNVTIPSLPRGDFVGLRALRLAGYRWALPRIYSLVHSWDRAEPALVDRF